MCPRSVYRVRLLVGGVALGRQDHLLETSDEDHADVGGVPILILIFILIISYSYLIFVFNININIEYVYEY